jgi:hypothetical protein
MKTTKSLKNIVIMGIVLVLGTTKINEADIFQYVLDVEGSYGLFDSQIVEVDLGVSFLTITDISVAWSGEITGELSTWGGDEYPSNGVFSLVLYETDPDVDSLAHTSIGGGLATYPEPEPFDLVQKLRNNGWDTFLDGVAVAKISFNRGDRIGDFVVIPSSGVLDSAELIVEGTVIPEPATILFFSTGSMLMGVRRITSNSCCKK